MMAAEPTRLDVEPPEVDLQVAEGASTGPQRHAASTCVVCGPDHPQTLGVFPGVIPDREVLATGWLPPAWSLNDEGVVRPEIVWGVLDCPGGWAIAGFNKGDRFFPALGTIAVDLRSPIAGDERVVVLGWPLGSEGRKHHAGTAIVGRDGEIKALARQTCIALDPSWALGDA